VQEPAAADDDVCTEELDSEEMVEEELEEAVAEHGEKGGCLEDHFVGEPMPECQTTRRGKDGRKVQDQGKAFIAAFRLVIYLRTSLVCSVLYRHIEDIQFSIESEFTCVRLVRSL